MKAIYDSSISHRLRLLASQTPLAASLQVANITAANITIVPSLAYSDTRTSLSPVSRVSSSTVVEILLGVFVGTLLIVVCASAYFKFMERREKEFIYKITSKDSTDDLLVLLFNISSFLLLQL